MFNQVLVVCIGNICRSPVGEALFAKGFSDLGLDVKVSSAGIRAMVGDPADPYSIEVAAAHGLDIRHHRARQITDEIVRGHDLILVMEHQHRRDLSRLFPYATGKVHLMGRFRKDMEIFDVWQKPKFEFDEMYEHLQNCALDWMRCFAD